MSPLIVKIEKILLYTAVAILGYMLGMLVYVSVSAAESCTTTVGEAVASASRTISTDVHPDLVGADITVRLRSGKEYTFTAETHKVVPRQQQVIVTHTERSTVKTCSQAQKNHLSLVAGSAPRGGLSRARSGNTQHVESQYGFTVGAQYLRTLDVDLGSEATLHVGGQLQDNETGLAVIGLGF